MFTHMLRPISAWGILTLCATGGIASANWTPVGHCNTCATPVAACAPVCPQPVACYQTVPVTEYREVRQTVRRPVCETKYIDQPCTEYRPVVEQCSVNVPTVSYEDVIECRSVCRDMGGWVTRYTPICKMSPCDYDNRPGVGGWLNRTAYSIRSSFTPDVIAHREYVPNMVTQTVPVRHRVAKHGTRQVTYNVTRMVAHTTTRKVAVNTVRYVDEQVVALQPVTVMRTVPIGTALAYGLPAAAPTRSALGPQPDPVSADRLPERRADASDDRHHEPEVVRPGTRSEGARREAPVPDPFDPASIRESRRDLDLEPGSEAAPGRRVSFGSPHSRHAARLATPAEPAVQAEAPRSVPSIVRVGQWTARRPADAEPAAVSHGISVAGQ